MADLKLTKDARAAASISFSSCEHGIVYVRLLDESGDIFAYGCLSPEAAPVAAEAFADAVDGVGAATCTVKH